jgi:hypothetical protein
MYKIVDIPDDAAESAEQLGTKYKFWYRDTNRGLMLFKEGRPNTGENWAEKISCELAELLEMPHAKYEFSRFQGKQGVTCNTLVERGAVLVHGNELLTTFETEYESSDTKSYKRREHTLSRVLSYFRASADLVGAPYGFRQSEGISNALDVFVGYLMFDAWIANQDRHDENWALLRTIDGNSFLSPSYDHGSSMGRNETDEKRKTMLTTRDMGQHISKYVRNARSAFFPQDAVNSSVKPLYTIEAFEQAARRSPDAAQAWKMRLKAISENKILSIFENVSDNLMSETAKNFTLKLLSMNRERILNCEILR